MRDLLKLFRGPLRRLRTRSSRDLESEVCPPNRENFQAPRLACTRASEDRHGFEGCTLSPVPSSRNAHAGRRREERERDGGRKRRQRRSSSSDPALLERVGHPDPTWSRNADARLSKSRSLLAPPIP